MTTKISQANIQAATLDSIGGGPKLASIVVTDSSYEPTGATTVAASGGYVKITGTGFISGAQVLFDETPAAAVTWISTTTLHAQVPARPVGTYFVYVVNPDGGTGLRTLGITVA